MYRKIVSIGFHSAVLLIAAAAAVTLAITATTWHVGGLLLYLWAALAAVMFSFRLAGGFGPDHLSIWAGPVWAIPAPAPPQPRFGRGLYRAY